MFVDRVTQEKINTVIAQAMSLVGDDRFYQGMIEGMTVLSQLIKAGGIREGHRTLNTIKKLASDIAVNKKDGDEIMAKVLRVLQQNQGTDKFGRTYFMGIYEIGFGGDESVQIKLKPSAPLKDGQEFKMSYLVSDTQQWGLEV